MDRLTIFQKIIIFSFLFFLLYTSMGCEAFRRKFVRKKKRPQEQVEMILEPQVYPESLLTNEQVYREYFTFWKSWHSELINSLQEGANRKKQKECIDGALKNLKKLAELLAGEKKSQLDKYLKDLILIQSKITKKSLSKDSIRSLRHKLETMKLQIDRDFVYSKVKDYIL